MFTLLLGAGATAEQARRIMSALGDAGISPAQLRAWLDSAARGYPCKRYEATGGPPKPISLPSGSRYVILRTPLA